MLLSRFFDLSTEDTAPPESTAGVRRVRLVPRCHTAAAFAALLMCASADRGAAGVFTVTNLNDSGAGSLRNAITDANAAAGGDLIAFADGLTGTIQLASTLPVISTNMHILGPGASALTVRGMGAANAFRIFEIRDLEAQTGNPDVTLTGMTITNGQTPLNGHGGAIANVNSYLLIENCVITGNRATASPSGGRGGAIYSSDSGVHSELTLINCSITNNSSASHGGAIFNFSDVRQDDPEGHGAGVTLTNCVATNNTCGGGGGLVYCQPGNEGRSVLKLTGCVVEINKSAAGGGAIHSGLKGPHSRHTTEISGCTFRGNDAGPGAPGPTKGGAVYVTGSADIRSSTFSNNQAGSGSAIFNDYAGTLLISGCSQEYVPWNDEGAIVNERRLTMENCTVAGWVSLRNQGTATISHCTITGTLINQSLPGLPATATLGNNILDGNLQVLSGMLVSNGWNIVSKGGGGFFTATGDQNNVDPKLDPAEFLDNGGPVRTIALTSGSPALDKGKRTGGALDQRGFPRTFDNPSISNAPGGDGTDIGAFEAGSEVVQSGIPSFVVTTLDDHNDGMAGAGDCTLREAILRSNMVFGRQAISFAPGLTGTITLKTSAGGPLNIQNSITITGPGARLLNISGNTQSRVFVLTGGYTSTISGMRISGGWAAGSGGADAEGGAIFNQSILTLRECTLDGNRALGGAAFVAGSNGGSGRGGAISNAGLLTLERCTLKNNSASGGWGANHPPPPMVLTFGGVGGHGLGGGIYNYPEREIRISNCTFAGNSAGGGPGGDGTFGGGGGQGLGGAIFNANVSDNGVVCKVTACTISMNSGSGGAGGLGASPVNNGVSGASAGGITTSGGAIAVSNSVIAGNLTAGAAQHDVHGAFQSGGFNLIGIKDGSTGFPAAGDQTGTFSAPLSAQLDSLTDNGGPTDTMMPQTGSTLMDRGKAFSLTVDQNGQPRALDVPSVPNAAGSDGTDIGAVEYAGVLIVTNLDDHDDGAASPADTTLREAIRAAMSQPRVEVIAFAPGLSGIIQLTSPLQNISRGLMIEGPGADILTVRRNSGGNYRIFTVSNGTAAGPSVIISGLTITNGSPAGGALPAGSGGGILNDRGSLSLWRCRITNNSAASGFTYYGGGVFNHEGALTIEGCRISGNSAYYGGGVASNRTAAGQATLSLTTSTLDGNTAAAGYGGAIYHSAVGAGTNATGTVSNSTLSGNSAANGFGGAVYASTATGGNGTLTLTHCTLFGNSASTGGGIYNFRNGVSSIVIVRNTILKAGASGANLANSGGTLATQGYNLCSDSGGGFLTATGDRLNLEPQLGPLTDNYGTTPTHLPLPGSPALDRGLSLGLFADQRGFPRPTNAAHITNAPGGDGADVGAVEVNPAASSGRDDDGDGMADEWETFYDGNDPGADPDNDGSRNADEYRAGTNPRDNSSFPVNIISVQRAGNALTIAFNGVAGKSFRLERADTLVNPVWASVPGVADLTPSANGNAQFTDPAGLSRQRSYYRVRPLP